jgi:hypothetical protein
LSTPVSPRRWNTRNSYVPRADGERFLVNAVLDAEDAPINVIASWAAGIK